MRAKRYIRLAALGAATALAADALALQYPTSAE
jgi:hypothetical protein